MAKKTRMIELVDRYDPNRSVRVRANIAEDGTIWLSERQLRAAERKSGMMTGSVMECVSDVLANEIYVFNGDRAVEILWANGNQEQT